MLFLEIIILGSAIAFFVVDPSAELPTNILLITVIVAVILHMAINVLFICRGKWFCASCK